MTENNRTFERQSGESDKAYNAFIIYRDMGPARSLEKVVAALGKRSKADNLSMVS